MWRSSLVRKNSTQVEPAPVTSGPTGPKRNRLRKFGLGALATLAGLLVGWAAVYGATTIDLTSAGAETTIDGAIFRQADFTDSSLGTGVINSFLRIQENGVEHGFNSGATPFDTKAGQFTKSILLSDIPLVEIDGVAYREIWLDVNETNKDTERYISLDAYEIWTSPTVDLPESEYVIGTGFTGPDEVLQYSIDGLGDHSLILDYSLASGSGQDGDLVTYIPESNFAGVADCAYGSTTCMTYFYLFATFGENAEANDYTDPADGIIDPTIADAGFEEFFVIRRPHVQVTKTAEYDSTLTYDWTIAKTATPDHTGFIGDSFSSDYEVSVERGEGVESSRTVTGTIHVANNGDLDAPIIELTDAIADFDGPVTVDCGAGFALPHTLAGGEVLDCTYTADVGDAAIGDTNTARVLLESSLGQTAAYYDTVDITVNDPTKVNASIDVSDVFDGGDPETLGTGVTTDDSWTYTQSFECTEDNSSFTGTTTTYENTASTSLGDSADAEVQLTCYVPGITKTAAGTYDEVHDWTITKTVDPESQSAFAGETVTFEWTIDIMEAITEENFDVAGTISVTNPNPDDTMTAALADTLSDGTVVTIDDTSCAFDAATGVLTVAAGTTEHCDYSALDLAYADDADAPDMNTASVTINDAHTYEATDPIEWTANVIGDDAELTDEYLEIMDQAVDAGSTGYPDDYTCADPGDGYVDGEYTAMVTNEAGIVWTGGTDDDSATTTVDCYEPSISKTVLADYDERHSWSITKTVDPERQAAFAGETVDIDWTITVDEDVTEENFAVDGFITVVNPNPDSAMVGALSDTLGDGTSIPITAAIGCEFDSATGMLTVPAGTTAVCRYGAGVSYGSVADAATSNTAEFTLAGLEYSTTVDFSWIADVIDGSVELDDDQHAGYPITISDDFEQTYPTQYTCSDDVSGYTDGAQLDNRIDNTATISNTDDVIDSDDATTYVDCYMPSISVVQTGAFDEIHEWEILKTVDPDSQSGGPGDELPWTWTVQVTETVTVTNFEISGTITLVNPHTSDDYVYELAQVVTDLAGSTIASAGDLDCDADDDGQVTVPADGSVDCNYTLAIGDAATFGAASFTSTPVATVVGPDQIQVSDTEIGLDTLVDGSTQAPHFTGNDSVTCSSDIADYPAQADGTLSYGETVPNTAYIHDPADLDTALDSSTAATTWVCEAAKITVTKTTNGSVDPDKDWVFEIYEGPDGFGGTLVESGSTLGANDGVIEFTTALTVGANYTICERSIPAAWEATASVNGIAVDPALVYNPDQDSSPPQDLGNRCYDFNVDASGHIDVAVDNRYGGGGQRTPGYWKNWSTCTGGRQQYTAANNGGAAEGFYLIDDLLPMTIGQLDITDCDTAVSLLDNRSTDDGRKRADDPAYRLARALIAAQANIAADASSCADVTEAVIEANELLTDIGFDGTGSYLKGKRAKAKAAVATELAGFLDAYNNGLIC